MVEAEKNAAYLSANYAAAIAAGEIPDNASHSSHSSIHEDEPERPNFVPMPAAAGQASGPLILMRKTTLNAK